MAGISKRQQRAKSSLYEIGYKYLCDNFHKFKKSEKIRISLEIVKKTLPYRLEHSDPVETHRKFFENVFRKSKETVFNGLPHDLTHKN